MQRYVGAYRASDQGDSCFLKMMHGVIPEVKQATDRDSREGGFRGRGGPGGRGRFFSRGLAAAGLARLPGAGGNDLPGQPQ